MNPSGGNMKAVIGAVCLATTIAVAPLGLAADKKPASEPVAWGILSQNSGCVVFAEGHKTSGMFWGVAVTTKTVGKLTVIETQNVSLDRQEYLETQETMDSLMAIAQKGRIKFVKIPEKSAPALLDKARALCTSAPE